MTIRRRTSILRNLSVVVLLCCSGASALARFEKTVAIKSASGVPGTHFDPHNHWNGVLQYRVLGGISKAGQQQIQTFLESDKGKKLKQLLGAAKNEEASVRIREFLSHHSLTRPDADGRLLTLAKEDIRRDDTLFQLLNDLEGSLMLGLWQELRSKQSKLASDEVRMAGGTQTLAKVLACDAEEDVKATKHLLQQVLTATPQIDFDTAYVARSLIEIPLLDQVRATLEELAYDRIGYVEMSHPISKFTPEQFLAPAVTEVLSRAETEGGPQVRWLPMLLTGMLADSGDGRTVVLDKEIGRCQDSGPNPVDMLKPIQVAEDGKSQLERVLEHPMVVGFDMASPERSCYTRVGAQHFIEALTIAYRVAKAHKKRLVAHVHVGEGFPAFASDTVSCKNPKAPHDLEPLHVRYQDGLPAHFRNAAANIEVLLAAVQAFRARLKHDVARFDDHIEVRFGHVTHATLAHARAMHALHIWADVNLTSNLATGALTIDGDDGADSLGITARRPVSLGNLRNLAADPSSVRLFQNHSLLTLLAAGVPVILGTDGGGIEHSSMPREYLLAGSIIDRALEDLSNGSFEVRITDKRKVKLSQSGLGRSPKTIAALQMAISLSRLYENQHLHYSFISESPSEKPPLPAREDPALRMLHDQLGTLQ